MLRKQNFVFASVGVILIVVKRKLFEISGLGAIILRATAPQRPGLPTPVVSSMSRALVRQVNGPATHATKEY